MSEFRRQPMRQARTIADELRSSRSMKGLGLGEIAEELRIPKKYLLALENGRYNDLPSPVYIKNYLQRYAKRLGVRWEAIEERYKQEISVYHQPDLPLRNENVLPESAKRQRRKKGTGAAHERPLVVGRWVGLGLILLVLVTIAMYFLWGLARLSTPPELVILQPAEDVIVSERSIEILGRTTPESIVEINGQAVSLETDGEFREEIFLHEGLNEIIVTTRSRRSSERVEVRNILYNPDQGGN